MLYDFKENEMVREYATVRIFGLRTSAIQDVDRPINRRFRSRLCTNGIGALILAKLLLFA